MARFLWGIFLLAALCGPVLVAAHRARRVWLPAFPAVAGTVGDAVLGAAAILAVAQVAGIIGILNAPVVLAGCLGLSAVVLRVIPASNGHAPIIVPAESGWERLLAVGLAAIAATHWIARTVAALERGTAGNVDTWWYHMPFAVRWVNDGSILELHHVIADPTFAFYPAHGSLLHAVGVLLMGSDVLSPALNLVPLAIGLGAGWAIGEAHGVPYRGLVAATVVLGLPVLAVSNAGDATTDVLALSFVLAALAILATGGVERRASVALAAVAVGLAAGTKLSMLWVAAGLTLGLGLWVRPGRRLGTVSLWAGVAAAAGGFWYVRNLIETGNPLPFVRIPLGFATLERPPSNYLDGPASASFLDMLGTTGFLSDAVPNDLGTQFGPLWPVLVALGVAGLVFGLTRSGFPRATVLGGGLAGAAFLATPTTGSIFLGQLRHVVVALAAALIVLLVGLRGRVAAALVATVTACFVAALIAPRSSEWAPARGVVGTVLVLAVVASAVVLSRGWDPRRRAALACGAIVLAAVGAGSRWHGAGGFVSGDVAESPVLQSGLERELIPAMRWAAQRRGERIAIVHVAGQLPLYGRALENRVQYVGVPGPHGAFEPARTCRQWWARVSAERASYVLVGDVGPARQGWPSPPPEHSWTMSDPRVTTVVTMPHVRLYRIPARPEPGCRMVRPGVPQQ